MDIPITVRVMLLCERIKERRGIYTLINPLTSIVLSRGDKNRLHLGTVFLYTQVSGGLGRCNLSVQVRPFESEFVVGRSDAKPLDFQGLDRNVVLEQVFRFADLSFKRSGLYEFQLFRNHVQVESGTTYLSILEGD